MSNEMKFEVGDQNGWPMTPRTRFMLWQATEALRIGLDSVLVD